MRNPIIILSLIILPVFTCYAEDVVGCLYDNDTKLRANPIGNRNPYNPSNPNSGYPAYNGNVYTVVTNKTFANLNCDDYYISYKPADSPSTRCYPYNGTTWTNFNGIIATISRKVCNVPIDDYIPIVVLVFGISSLFFFRRLELNSIN
ncbi:hypothetical protein [Pedobacter sp.]|uniref:hypothetical protein n=1 Tax=Pedobacter sp. TaxID=1411316 RepID=UPI003BACBCDE